MKSRFNRDIALSGVKVNEINLFRLLANEFNTKVSKGIFVKETHSHKGFIEYNSRILGRRKVVEISDLLFLTYNKRLNELRMTFMQAKFKKEQYKKFISFRGNVFQRELLTEKPDISDINKLGFHKNSLNFTSYESITSYGVFYTDLKGEIDFLYTMPQYLQPLNLHTKTGITRFEFNPNPYCPYKKCMAGKMKDETISTCSLDVFTNEVLQGRVGAPVNLLIFPYIRSLIYSMLSVEPYNSVLIELSNNLSRLFDTNDLEFIRKEYDVFNHMNAVIVLTDGYSDIDLD